LCKLVSHVVLPENMGPIANSKYPVGGVVI
jgi:hypothetical protein